MAGTINFNVIPSTNRVPGVFAEVDASQANTGQANQRTLLIGQMLAGNTGVPDVPVISVGIADAKTKFGAGSMLANMLVQYRGLDPFGEVWLLPVSDNGAGALATGSICIGSPGTVGSEIDATGNGTLSLYIAGVSVPVGVSAGQSNDTIAGHVLSAVNANLDLPVIASLGGGTGSHVVTFTAKHKGVAAMDADIRVNYRGSLNNEALPEGVAVTITAMSGGSGDPDITAALANLSSTTFDFICIPYTGSANLNAFETFIGDLTGRWSYLSELFGGGFSAYRGNFSALTTFGTSRNDQHLSVMGFYDSPTPAYLVAADYCAACANSLRVDPALPLGGAGDGVTMRWLPPPVQHQFDFSERNSLLYDGISTFLVEPDGRVRVEYAVTTYQLNGAGSPDDSYLDVETLYTLQFLIRDLRIDLQTKFARKKLVDNGARISFGNNFVTPQIVLNEAIANYNKNAALGLCQNTAIFAQNAYAQNQGNGQLALFLPFDLANQLRQIKALVQFVKS